MSRLLFLTMLVSCGPRCPDGQDLTCRPGEPRVVFSRDPVTLAQTLSTIPVDICKCVQR